MFFLSFIYLIVSLFSFVYIFVLLLRVRLKANSNCCVRLLLSQEGGTEKRAMDFVLYENTKKTVVLEGLQPGRV